MARTGAATPGEYASERSRCVDIGFVARISILPGLGCAWKRSASSSVNGRFLDIWSQPLRPEYSPRVPRHKGGYMPFCGAVAEASQKRVSHKDTKAQRGAGNSTAPKAQSIFEWRCAPKYGRSLLVALWLCV